MADKIDLISHNAAQWDISYTVEKSGKSNAFCVRVLKSEMTDPTSETEAKTKANVKAKTTKDAWTPSTDTIVETLSEPISVTL